MRCVSILKIIIFLILSFLSLYLFLFLFLFLTPPLFSLPSDDNQLIYVSSDSFNMNYPKGLATYQGHVIVDQGSRHLTANTLIIHRNNLTKQIDKLTAYGAPAVFKTLPEINGTWVHGHGDIIYFYPMTHELELIHHAYLTQNGNDFYGEKVTYNTLTQIVTSPDSKTGQSLMILQPLDASPSQPKNKSKK